MLRQIHPLPVLLCCSLAFACGGDGRAADAALVDAPPASGTLSLSWTVSDGASVVPCDNVGASVVSLSLLRQGDLVATRDSFPCSAGESTSRLFSPGVYDVSIDLEASGRRSLLAESVLLLGLQIDVDTDTPLAAQAFEVSPVGGFSFSIDGRSAGGNCVLDSEGGAGIESLTMALKNTGGTCLDASFEVAAGSRGTAASYTHDCSSPAVPLPCIDEDQVITVTSLSSGPTTLEIAGNKAGPTRCYDRVSNFIVPGAMLVTELGAQPLLLENSAACDPNFDVIDAGIPDAGVPDAGLPDAAP